jgi:hypothetical protein
MYGFQAQAEPGSGRIFQVKLQSDLTDPLAFGITKIFFL